MRIASVADVKARLSSFLKASADGPVVVTRNGKAIAVLLGIHGQLLRRHLQLQLELARAIGDQPREQLAHLREARGHLRAHVRIAHAVGPELHEQQQQLGLALDHRHPRARAACGALGDGCALRHSLGDNAGVLGDLAFHQGEEQILLAVEVRVEGTC